MNLYQNIRNNKRLDKGPILLDKSTVLLILGIAARYYSSSKSIILTFQE